MVKQTALDWATFSPLQVGEIMCISSMLMPHVCDLLGICFSLKSTVGFQWRVQAIKSALIPLIPNQSHCEGSPSVWRFGAEKKHVLQCSEGHFDPQLCWLCFRLHGKPSSTHDPSSCTSKIGKSLNSSSPRRSRSHLGNISLVAAKGRHAAAMEASALAKRGRLGLQKGKAHIELLLSTLPCKYHEHAGHIPKTLYVTPLKFHPQQPTKYFLQPFLLNNPWKAAALQVA